MSFRSMREQRHLSQEKVAELSGLSLRTVQRLEAGHRVSYASLRALAISFNTNPDLLEQELYAMKNPDGDFVEIPRWIRALNAWPFEGKRLSRKEVLAVELLCIVLALSVFSVSFLVVPETKANVVRAGAAVAFAAAYLVSVFVRILDGYNLWQHRNTA